MKSNNVKLCLNCGRSFVASKNKHPFCSLNCKIRYSNHRGFRCSDCRTVSCKLRNNGSFVTPDGCPNFNWNYSRK